MQRASQVLSADDRDQICRAVAQAESSTSAEIVPVVATISGRYDRAEDVVGLWLSVIALAIAWRYWPQTPHEHGSWSGLPAWIDFVVLAASVVVGFLVGAILASRIGWLRRIFTPSAMLRDEVQSRARHVFFDTRVHHTQSRGGLLIYVSLFERQAIVLADAAIVERLGQPALDALCGRLTDALRRGNLSSALCESIAAAGQQLANVLPRQSDDVNELPDALVILDKAL